MRNELNVSNLILQVKIGWEEKEREVPQSIRMDYTINFLSPCKAMESKKLSDTVCYDQLCSKIKAIVQTRSFILLENLAYTLFIEMKKSLSKDQQLSLKVAKINPPVEDIKGNVSFHIGD